eukprot:244161-Pyramimonas_sp.AAC.1
MQRFVARELHRSPQWDRPRASWKLNLAFSLTPYSVSWPYRELPSGRSAEAPSGTTRMSPTHQMWHLHPRNTAFRGPIGSSTETP